MKKKIIFKVVSIIICLVALFVITEVTNNDDSATQSDTITTESYEQEFPTIKKAGCSTSPSSPHTPSATQPSHFPLLTSH